MGYIASIGLGSPTFHLEQNEVKNLIKDVFTTSPHKTQKLLPVFDNAKINSRQFVVDEKWIKQDHTFAEKNAKYIHDAVDLSVKAIDHCLKNVSLLQANIPYEAVDLIVFVSSTGIATPSLDAHLLNERPFREDVIRMPLWGLGCAGGAMGLARAYEWIRLFPEKIALVVCCELCSLTFQKQDTSTSNIVGTALFGDGVAATLLVGTDSPYRDHLLPMKLVIRKTSSFTKKNSINVMGWNVTANGLEVIFSKRIPKLVKSLWKDHIFNFLEENNQSLSDIGAFIAHPGGRKVLEEMEEVLFSNQNLLNYSYQVLQKHGNMSSATVMYVLRKWLLEASKQSLHKKKGILCALGPGFSSELLLTEWTGE